MASKTADIDTATASLVVLTEAVDDMILFAALIAVLLLPLIENNTDTGA